MLAAIATVLAVVIGVGLVIRASSRDSGREANVAERRAIYAQFRPYPGSIKTSEVIAELKADGNPTGTYDLEISYQLPPDVTSREVLTFFRAQIPRGWTEASDATCAASLARLPAPPTATSGDDEEVPPISNRAQPTLMLRRSQLTLFEGSGGVDGKAEGVTLSLTVVSGSKTVTLGPVEYSCGADTSDHPADDFDAL